MKLGIILFHKTRVYNSLFKYEAWKIRIYRWENFLESDESSKKDYPISEERNLSANLWRKCYRRMFHERKTLEFDDEVIVQIVFQSILWIPRNPLWNRSVLSFLLNYIKFFTKQDSPSKRKGEGKNWNPKIREQRDGRANPNGNRKC